MEEKMVKQKHSRQSWWPIYMLALMMIGLLFLVSQVAPSPGWRTFWEIVIVVVDYGLIMWWLEKHSKQLIQKEEILMADLLYLAVTLIFFVASWGLIVGFEKLMEE